MFDIVLTEAGDVQKSDVTDRGGEGDSLVYTGHDVVKQATINRLSQRVPGTRRFTRLKGHSEIIRLKKISVKQTGEDVLQNCYFQVPYILYYIINFVTFKSSSPISSVPPFINKNNSL